MAGFCLQIRGSFVSWITLQTKAHRLYLAHRAGQTHRHTNGDETMAHFYSAWEAHTGSVYQWIEALLENNEIDAQDVVWAGSDGSYAVGYLDSDDIDAEDMDKYTDAGSVTEFLTDAEPRRQAAAVLGRRGGTVRTDAKAAAVRANGRKGGRPRKKSD